MLERLRLKRYALKRKINRFHSPIVRKLPPDVTSTIFELCLPDFTDNPLSYYPEEDISIPLSLGAICSYWRDIAWSTPSLWSSLVVRVTSKHKSPITIGIAQEWLARSGQLPLSIRIASALRDHQAMSALADIINQYSIRWSELDLNIPDHHYQYFHATENHAPILKFIRFYGPRCATDLNFKLTCPRLERANFSSFPIDETNIQFDNLTHLTLQFTSLINSLPILRQTPRLVFLKFSGSCERYEGPGLGALVLTSLKYLELLSWDLAEDFLNNLIAPQLEELRTSSYIFTSMETITSFIRRSACSLRSFSMYFTIFPPYFEAFMDCLQVMPSLNKISIMLLSSTSVEDNTPKNFDPRSLFQLLAKVLSSQSTSPQQGFLPNLKILEYSGKLYLRPGNYDDFYSLPPTDDSIHGPFHLLKLDLDAATHIPKDMISCLLSLVERGITVNVSNNSKDILQSSIDYHRCKEESLAQDENDSFDLQSFF